MESGNPLNDKWQEFYEVEHKNESYWQTWMGKVKQNVNMNTSIEIPSIILSLRKLAILHSF